MSALKNNMDLILKLSRNDKSEIMNADTSKGLKLLEQVARKRNVENFSDLYNNDYEAFKGMWLFMYTNLSAENYLQYITVFLLAMEESTTRVDNYMYDFLRKQSYRRSGSVAFELRRFKEESGI